MDISSIVANQVVIIFILIAIGFTLTKIKLLTKKGADEFTTLLLNVVTPCVLLNAYQERFSIAEAKKLGEAALLTVIIHAVAIIIGSFIFRKSKENKINRINIFATVYSNCGFMAIPLLSAALGEKGVFYGSMYLAIFTPLYWVHGIYVCTGGDKKEISFKKCFLNPGFVGTVLSLILFVSGTWHNLPAPLEPAISTVKSVISYMAGLNTPLSMVVIGYHLAGVKFPDCLKKPSIYLVCLLRLICIPIICVYAARLLDIHPDVAKAIIIPAACPTAAVATLFASRYQLDARYATEIVSVSTLLSIITIPLVLMLL